MQRAIRKDKSMNNIIQFPVKQETKTFIAGRSYSTASACDHNAIFQYKVISRRLTTITIIKEGKEKRCKIYTDDHGVEYFLPEGKYSMCPVIRANR